MGQIPTQSTRTLLKDGSALQLPEEWSPCRNTPAKAQPPLPSGDTSSKVTGKPGLTLTLILGCLSVQRRTQSEWQGCPVPAASATSFPSGWRGQKFPFPCGPSKSAHTQVASVLHELTFNHCVKAGAMSYPQSHLASLVLQASFGNQVPKPSPACRQNPGQKWVLAGPSVQLRDLESSLPSAC